MLNAILEIQLKDYQKGYFMSVHLDQFCFERLQLICRTDITEINDIVVGKSSDGC